MGLGIAVMLLLPPAPPAAAWFPAVSGPDAARWAFGTWEAEEQQNRWRHHRERLAALRPYHFSDHWERWDDECALAVEFWWQLSVVKRAAEWDPAGESDTLHQALNDLRRLVGARRYDEAWHPQALPENLWGK